jgi:hypothetical protein
MAGPVIQIKKNTNANNMNAYHGKFIWNPVFGASINDKFRAIASGNGKTKNSPWSKLLIQC